MNSPLARDESGKPNLRTYENNGFLYGLPTGALIGTLIAGPHFYDWPVWESLVAIFGGGIGGGVLGYAAVAMAYGSEASGTNHVPSSSEENNTDSAAEKRSNSRDRDDNSENDEDGHGVGDQ